MKIGCFVLRILLFIEFIQRDHCYYQFYILLSKLNLMYAIVDGIQFIGSIAAAIYAIAENKWYIGIASGIFFFTYPILNQLIYNAFAKLFAKKQRYQPDLKSRLVYHSGYNLSFCGLQKLHPFDAQKYGNVVAQLIKYGIFTENQFIKPGKISRSTLLQKMQPWYLMKLCYSIPLCKCIQMPLCFIPNFLLRWRVLNPMLLATEGTLVACEVANSRRWAVNLSGGYHHASTSNGGGFCVYPDITLAVHYIRTRLQKDKVMIIDLDAHQGNGYQRDLIGDSQAFIIDCYNHSIYPGDGKAKNAIKLDIGVSHFTSDYDYLMSLRQIQSAIQKFKPQFIIYNAGTDTLEGDPLGNLNLSKDCHIKRDEYIINLGLNNDIPVVMLLSGGYQKTNAMLIAESIKNLTQKFDYGKE